jgi:hypothetical protein
MLKSKLPFNPAFIRQAMPKMKAGLLAAAVLSCGLRFIIA